MRSVRHSFSCPLRWADLDMLGHVNNVRYADYMREARNDLARTAGIDLGPAGLLVRRHELTFVAPLLFGPEPVVVDCWLSELTSSVVTVEYVVHDGAASPRTYLRARSVASAQDERHEPRELTERELAALSAYVEPGEERDSGEPLRVRSEAERRYPLTVRVSDLDLTGRASDVALVEYFQEARIGFFSRLLHELPDTARLHWVVAQTDIDLLTPIPPRSAPYDCFSRLARVGNKSLQVESVIRDEHGKDHATARVVLVVFDPETQRATAPPEGYRELLEGFVEED